MAYAPINNITGSGYTTANSGIVRRLASANGTALATGVMTSVSIWLPAGITVTSIGFVSATTAADTPTHWGYALYSSAATPAKLAQTADQTTTAFAANTLLYKALATPQVISKGAYYWVSMWMAATGCPTLLSSPALTAGLLNVGGINPIAASDVALAVTSGTAIAATAPATIATPTNSLVVPLCFVK